MPPSRPNDSSPWLPKSQNWLPSTKPHSSSQINIRRVASSRVWAVGATPWVLLGSEWACIMSPSSRFSISHAFWLLPVVSELLCRNLLCEQYQNSWFPVEWRLKWAGDAWSNLKVVSWLLLSRWRGWHAAVPLFF